MVGRPARSRRTVAFVLCRNLLIPALPVAAVPERLAEAAENSDHEFWPDDVNLLKNDSLAWTKVLGHRQVTDAYLLAMAVHNKGCFVTMDRRISLAVVTGAKPKNLSIIAALP